jgi:AcrR family transcriptional regulator
MDKHSVDHIEQRLRDIEQRPLSPRLTRLLDTLEGLFFEEGFLKFRMDDLARRLRCSKHTLYVLAPSREELFELVIERFLSRVRAQGEAAANAAPNRISAVTAYLESAVHGTRRNSVQFISDLAEFLPGRRRLRNHQRQRVAGLESIVAAGVAEGAFGPIHPKLVAEVMIHTIGKIVDPHFLAACGLTVSEAYREFYHWMVYGLGPVEELKTGGPEAWSNGSSDRTPRNNGRA